MVISFSFIIIDVCFSPDSARCSRKMPFFIIINIPAKHLARCKSCRHLAITPPQIKQRVLINIIIRKFSVISQPVIRSVFTILCCIASKNSGNSPYFTSATRMNGRDTTWHGIKRKNLSLIDTTGRTNFWIFFRVPLIPIDARNCFRIKHIQFAFSNKT